MLRAAFVVVLVVLSGCVPDAMLRGHIGDQYGCPADRVEILENHGNFVRARICGRVATCRFSRDVNTWVCDK